MNSSVVGYVTADEACTRLGISPDTLYAYVSRGVIAAAKDPEDARRSLYSEADIDARKSQMTRGRSRREVASAALHWGEAALPSSITTIQSDALRYRDQDAIQWSHIATLEKTAELLIDRRIAWHSAPLITATAQGKTPLARLLSVPAIWAGHLHADEDWHAPAGPLLYQMIAAVCPEQSQQSLEPAHVRLARAFGTPDKADLVRRALVLCADHELNASTFAARVAASAGANLPACVLAGLSTLSGTNHGGMTPRARAWMHQAAGEPDLVSRRDHPPGFGHPLYPGTDPRAAEMMRLCPAPRTWQRIMAQVTQAQKLHPTLDLGLAVMTDQLGWPDTAGFAIFAIGRTVGWIAHAHEQRNQGSLIRPRAYQP